MSKAPFVVREYVRWSDVDPAGIIRYDAYTRFMELGESELFRSLGIPYRTFFTRFGVSVPRRVMHMEFTSPPTLDERLEVAVYVSEVGTTSMTMNFDIYGDEGVMRMYGLLVLVCVSPEGMRKEPWPVELLSIIDKHRLTVAEARHGRAGVTV